ncbi:hypothetical protein [Bdellovibrio bacteriovorus]|uniref:hypothetical protein n=1 Tax=Bdellovibrio bacteriovorus TaxID=959 RepID=UPI0035A7346E
MQRKRRKKCIKPYKPEYGALFAEHIKVASRNSFAGVLKVAESTLYEWARKHPDFRKLFMSAKKKKVSIYA